MSLLKRILVHQLSQNVAYVLSERTPASLPNSDSNATSKARQSTRLKPVQAITAKRSNLVQSVSVSIGTTPTCDNTILTFCDFFGLLVAAT